MLVINDFGASGLVPLGEPLPLHDVKSHIMVCSLTIIVCGSNRALGTAVRFSDLPMVLHTDHLIGTGLLPTPILDSGNFMMDTLLILLLCDSLWSGCCDFAFTQLALRSRVVVQGRLVHVEKILGVELEHFWSDRRSLFMPMGPFVRHSRDCLVWRSGAPCCLERPADNLFRVRKPVGRIVARGDDPSGCEMGQRYVLTACPLGRGKPVAASRANCHRGAAATPRLCYSALSSVKRLGAGDHRAIQLTIAD